MYMYLTRCRTVLCHCCTMLLVHSLQFRFQFISAIPSMAAALSMHMRNCTVVNLDDKPRQCTTIKSIGMIHALDKRCLSTLVKHYGTR